VAASAKIQEDRVIVIVIVIYKIKDKDLKKTFFNS
jgi:hypothetical protein